MTADEWDQTHYPRRLIAATEISVRKQRLIGVAACRTLPPDVLSPKAERWFAAADRYAERCDFVMSYKTARDHLFRGSARTGPDHRGFYAYMATFQLFTGPLADSLSYVGQATGRVDPAGEWEHPDITVSDLVRDIIGNPFRPVAFAPDWRTSTAVALAREMYAAREFDRLPVLADALEEAGCDAADLLAHCRGPGPHVRGCWAVDLVLGKT